MQFERQTEPIEVSVVIPCLNEEDTLARCIEKARRALREHNIAGEIVVADNDSTDSSRAIAEREQASVVTIKEPGYGSALMGGIAAASGRFVIIGDADDSDDFLEIPNIVEKLREGSDLVQGCRLPAGGGSIRPGAMPFLHRWVGNPFFSFLVRKWFHAPINDVYCGLRGFTKAMYERLDQRCTRLPVDSLRHLRQDICHYGGIPPTRPSLGTLFRIDEFGKRAGRGGACDPRGWRSTADCCPAMVADWFRPFGLRLHDAIRRAPSNAGRLGVSNRLLQLFRQHSWDVTKMSLIDSVHRGPQSLGVRENCR